MAGSPVRHESAVQGSAVEVQTYQPPWKALSDFALQSDLEPPAAFQQLVSPGHGGERWGGGWGVRAGRRGAHRRCSPRSPSPSPALWARP